MKKTAVGGTTSFLMALLLAGCGTVGAHAPLMTSDQTDAPTPEHNLVVANVYIDPTGFALTDLITRNTETGRVYTFPFIDNIIMGSKRLDVERVNFGDQEVNHHVLFLDLPAGSYQVTVVGFGDEGSNFERLRYDALDELFLEVPGEHPTYLGDLLIVLDDDVPRGLLGAKVAIGFSPIDADANGIHKLQSEYPALRKIDFKFGKIIRR